MINVKTYNKFRHSDDMTPMSEAVLHPILVRQTLVLSLKAEKPEQYLQIEMPKEKARELAEQILLVIGPV